MGNIVVINGLSNSGKDTLCDMCGDITHVYNISTIDKVREASKLLGCISAKNSSHDRNFLGELKQLAIKYYNHSEKYIHSRYLNIKKSTAEVLDEHDFTMFIHTREPNEIEFFKNKYKDTDNVVTLLVKSSFSDKITDSIPDKEVYNYTYDYIIDNDSNLKGLRDKANLFMKELLNGN